MQSHAAMRDDGCSGRPATDVAPLKRLSRGGFEVPRNRRPSFLTKQKEQQRRAKATEKREARRARRKARTTTTETGSESGPAAETDSESGPAEARSPVE